MTRNKKNTKNVVMLITEKCNLKCVYCYETNKTRNKMSFETAKEIICRELFAENDYDEVLFNFFGGEPFLEFNLIKNIVEYTKSNSFPKKYKFFAMTNGTLIHKDIQDWLLDNKNIIQIGLSLDGDRGMHNANRSNSFDSIDLQFYKENYSKQGIKLTISPQTLPKLFQGVKFCHENHLYCACSFAVGYDWSNIEYQGILIRELEKLIEYYIANPDIQPCSMLGLPIEPVFKLKENFNDQLWCDAGISSCAYDTNGRWYPCHFFMPVAVGENKAEKSFELKFPLKNMDKKQTLCEKCLVRPICPMCYGYNYCVSGNPFQQDMSLCALNRIVIAYRANFYLKRIENGQEKVSIEEKNNLLQSIEIIKKEIDINAKDFNKIS